MKYFKWSNKYLVIIVLLIAFYLGLSVSSQYGSYWDQSSEEQICLLNVHEYYNRFQHTEWPPISESADKDHGVALYYPIGFCGLLEEQTSYTSEVWHYYTFVLFFCGCLALYGIIYELFGSHKLSLIGFGLYYLSPRIFAEGHYNNKDIILLTLGLATIYFGMKYIRSQKLWCGLLFAVSAAFMTNVKIIGAWFFAVIGITYLIWNIWNRRVNISKLIDGFHVIIGFVFVFLLITPAAWDGLIDYVVYCIKNASSFSRWEGKVLYAGRFYILPEDHIPADYLPLQILYTTPLALTILGLIGHIRAVVAIVRREKNAVFYLMLFALYLVPFIYAVTNKNLIIYNGWRHFYFIYGPLVIFMGVGCEALIRLAKRQCVGYGVLGGVLVYLLALVVSGHPFQYSYINCLASRPAQDDWQLDYWCVGDFRALSRLYDSPDRDVEKDLTVAMEGAGTLPYTIYRFADCWDYEMSYVEMNAGEPANYVISNLTYADMPPEGYHLLFSMEAYGNTLYDVYERD